jgi:hypothetical protein
MDTLEKEYQEMKHTPGPWSVGPEYYDNPKKDMRAVYCGTFAVTATSVARHVKPLDAALIAAAPEMLAELKMCWSIFSSASGAEQHVDRLAAIIARAEGRI